MKSRLLSVTCIFSLITILGGEVCADPMLFTDVTTSAGITAEHYIPSPTLFLMDPRTAQMSGGAVCEDFNGDGYIDVYYLQTDSNQVNSMYINQTNGTFVDEAVARGVALAGFHMGAGAADYDNDGDIDICVTVAYSKPLLLDNDGTGNFTVNDQMLSAVLDEAMSASWGDINNDGLLELAVGQWYPENQSGDPTNLWMYFNLGGGILTNYQFRTDPSYKDRHVFTPRFHDMDGDGDTDLLTANDFEREQVYENNGDSTFDRVTSTAIGGTNVVADNGMGAAMADYDNDGDLDWFESSIRNPDTGKEGNKLWKNDGGGVFNEVAEGPAQVHGGPGYSWGWGSAFGDLDNDGDLDLFHVNGWQNKPKWENVPARLFENMSDGSFTNVAVAVGAGDTGTGRGVALLDYDNDGDMDIFIANGATLSPTFTVIPGKPALLRNDSANGNHWLQVTLQGTPPFHRNGIGSWVYVRKGTNTQLRDVHASSHFLATGPSRITHFGTGTNTTVDEVRAHWAGGDCVIVSNIATDQRISVPSPEATVSPRIVGVGVPVTASKASITNPVIWVIDGTEYTNSAVVSFGSEGPQELTALVYDATTTTVLRVEILRITVTAGVETVLGCGSVPLGGIMDLSWNAESGCVYHVHHTLTIFPYGWSPAGPPVTATVNGVMNRSFTNVAGACYYRILKVE